MSAAENRTGNFPPAYQQTTGAGPQSYQHYPMAPVGPTPTQNNNNPFRGMPVWLTPQTRRSNADNGGGGRGEELRDLGEIDPASLIPGKGPGGAPHQYFNVS